MGIIVNGTEILAVKYNGVYLEKVYYDGTLYWEYRYYRNLTVENEQVGYDLYNELVKAGWDEELKVVTTLEVNGTLRASNRYNYALEVQSLPDGSSVTLINNGKIKGAGGQAGDASGGNGTPGGDAILARSYLDVENNGQIWAGGGGGGAGGKALFYNDGSVFGKSGGGGGGGAAGNPATGGGSASGTYMSSGQDDHNIDYADDGQAGSVSSGGAGGDGTTITGPTPAYTETQGGDGGNGGDPGQGGQDGQRGSTTSTSYSGVDSVSSDAGGQGGSGGDPVNGSGFVTYTTYGDVR